MIYLYIYGCNFNCKSEFNNDKSEQSKLTIINNQNIIQGL